MRLVEESFEQGSSFQRMLERLNNLSEAAVPNLKDQIGKTQVQSDLKGIGTIKYVIDYQNPDNLDEVTITINTRVNGTTYRLTVNGWDEAFDLMSNLKNSIIEAYKEGLQKLLLDFSLNISRDPTDETSTDPITETTIDHKALKKSLESIVANLDNYVFDPIVKEITASGFIPIVK